MNTDIQQFAENMRDAWTDLDRSGFMCYNPSVIRSFIPEDKQKFWDDHLLTPICPCCGEGRTLFVHLAKQPALVIPATFADWCSKCRKELASKLK